MKKRSVYFPNLNGLRFIAAAMVFFPHIEQIKMLSGMPSQPELYHPDLGHLGVILFFVLSGFLITYLLLDEKRQSGRIHVRKFYARRILRIWPLYYFVVLAGLFLLPYFDFFTVPLWPFSPRTEHLKIFLFLFFMPNVAFAAFIPVPFISQTWSVGVEEQFYLIWPVLLKLFKSTLAILVFIIIAYLIVTGAAIKASEYSTSRYLIIAVSFLKNFAIDCMAIGGVAAYILFHNKTGVTNVLFKRYVQFLTYVAVVVLLASRFRTPYLMDELFAVFFSIIILNLAANKKSIISLENKVLTYLGKISYGIYMYHFFAIFIVLKCLHYFDINNGVITRSACLIVTIIVAGSSYSLFESRFIKAKRKYSIIVSGDNTRQTIAS